MKGNVTAQDREAASALLRQRSISVVKLELREMASDAANSPQSSTLEPSRALWRMWDSPVERVMLTVGGILFSIGLLYFVAAPGANRDSGKRNRGGAKESLVHLTVTGRLELPAGVNSKQVRAVVHLPEVPLNVRGSGRELFRDENGNFSLDIRFRTTTPPTTFSFFSEADGAGKLELSNLHLQPEADDPSSGETRLTYNLNSLKLPHAKAIKKAELPVPFPMVVKPRPTRMPGGLPTRP